MKALHGNFTTFCVSLCARVCVFVYVSRFNMPSFCVRVTFIESISESSRLIFTVHVANPEYPSDEISSRFGANPKVLMSTFGCTYILRSLFIAHKSPGEPESIFESRKAIYLKVIPDEPVPVY